MSRKALKLAFVVVLLTCAGLAPRPSEAVIAPACYIGCCWSTATPSMLCKLTPTVTITCGEWAQGHSCR